MSDPFLLDGPATVSFSGGRTSGLMLRRVLDAGRQADVLVCFANTGAELDETLHFVKACSEHWSVRIWWLEYRPPRWSPGWRFFPGEQPHDNGYALVDWSTASRAYQPFDALLAERTPFLPNPTARFCTSELKLRPMKRFMLSLGYEHWTNCVGIRADEPRRVAKMRAPGARKERYDVDLPLADAGITVADVMAYWAESPFDLALRPWEGNCDICLLKGVRKRRRIMRDRPERASWWIAHEQRTNHFFRVDTPSYAVLLRQVQTQPMLIGDYPSTSFDDLDDCACTD